MVAIAVGVTPDDKLETDMTTEIPDPTNVGGWTAAEEQFTVGWAAMKKSRLDYELAEKAAAAAAIRAERASLSAALLSERAAEQTAANGRSVAEVQAEVAIDNAIATKMIEVAGGVIERYRDAAKFIQTAAAWLAGVYTTGLLALKFSKDRSVPVRAIWSIGFFGLSVAFALAFLAFVLEPRSLPLNNVDGTVGTLLSPNPGEEGNQPNVPATEEQPIAQAKVALTHTDESFNSFVEWANSPVLARRHVLRAAVVAFTVGVALLPGAFIEPATTAPVPPKAPALPERVPIVLSSEVQAIVSEQLTAYKKAQASYETAATEYVTQASKHKCGGPVGLSWTCADQWKTEAGVERSFRDLAITGLELVILVPLLFGILERLRRWWRKDRRDPPGRKISMHRGDRIGTMTKHHS